LLREALRLTERTRHFSEIEGLKAAAHVMRVIPKAANDMMDVGRLQGFDVRLFSLVYSYHNDFLIFLEGLTKINGFFTGENNCAG